MTNKKPKKERQKANRKAPDNGKNIPVEDGLGTPAFETSDTLKKGKRKGAHDSTEFAVESVIQSLENGASISVACKSAGISRMTFWRWKNEKPENSERYYSIIDSRTSVVEDALYNNAVKGNVTAQIFWLKNRATDRWKDFIQGEFKVGNVVVKPAQDVPEIEFPPE